MPNYPSYSSKAFDAPPRDAAVLRKAALLLKMYGVVGTCYYTIEVTGASPRPFVVAVAGHRPGRFRTASAMLRGVKRIITMRQVKEFEGV